MLNKKNINSKNILTNRICKRYCACNNQKLKKKIKKIKTL